MNRLSVGLNAMAGSPTIATLACGLTILSLTMKAKKRNRPKRIKVRRPMPKPTRAFQDKRRKALQKLSDKEHRDGWE